MAIGKGHVFPRETSALADWHIEVSLLEAWANRESRINPKSIWNQPLTLAHGFILFSSTWGSSGILLNLFDVFNIKNSNLRSKTYLKRLVRCVASFSQSMSPWRATATHFRPDFPNLPNPIFDNILKMSNSNLIFEFMVGSWSGLDLSEKKHIGCLYL